MKSYSIGEIARLLGIKPHIIRYWEKEFPMLKPQRNLAGRRVYTLRELQFLFRLNYLHTVKGYSLRKAKQMIWQELSTEPSEAQLKLRQLRTELLELLERLTAKKERLTFKRCRYLK